MTYTVDDLRRFFARVAYRPGWRFTVKEDPFEGPHLHIDCQLEDAYHPGHMVTLNIISPLPPMSSDEQVIEWLRWRLTRIETHEVREWLRLDGERIYNPHDGIERT